MLTNFINFIFYHTPVFYLIQSVWRDEAFSYFMAKPNVIQVIINTANDFNPPFYYLLLHFWMKFVGQSDEGLRLLSLIPHLATVYIAYIFAEKVMSKRFASFVAAFTFFNPMLLYYGYEMRMYSFFAFFTLATFYFFYIKKWKWYLIFAVLGLFTHSFFPMIIVSFALYFFLTHPLNKKSLWLLFKPFIFYLPWLPVLAIQFINSKNSWLYPVDLQLIFSVLGNLFTGYEGTPGNYWFATAILSIVILIFMIIGNDTKRKERLLFLSPIFLPLLAILGYSVVKRPLFVNRYMIFVTVFEILAICWGIWGIRNKTIKSAAIVFWLILIIVIDIWFAPYHKKTDFKSTFAEINEMATPSDFVYTRTPIGFLESAYYFKNKNKVFVYNPQGITIPNYIGVNVVFPDASRSTFSPTATRTFLVADDASYDLIISQ